jgi:hypothetical protein
MTETRVTKDFRSQSPTGPKHFPTKSDTRTALFCANRAKSRFSASAVNALIAADFARNRANSQRDAKRRANPIDGRIVKLNTDRKIRFRPALAVAFRAMMRHGAIIVSVINYTLFGSRDRLVVFR